MKKLVVVVSLFIMFAATAAAQTWAVAVNAADAIDLGTIGIEGSAAVGQHWSIQSIPDGGLPGRASTRSLTREASLPRLRPRAMPSARPSPEDTPSCSRSISTWTSDWDSGAAG